MSGADIAREIHDALGEAASELGSGAPLTAILLKQVEANFDVYPPVLGGEIPHTIRILIDNYEAIAVDGSGILPVDIRLLVSAHGLPVTIETNDRIRIGTNVYYVENSPAVQPGGVAIMYEVQARKR